MSRVSEKTYSREAGHQGDSKPRNSHELKNTDAHHLSMWKGMNVFSENTIRFQQHEKHSAQIQRARNENCKDMEVGSMTTTNFTHVSKSICVP